MRMILIMIAVLAVDSPEIQRWRSCQSRPGVQQGNDGCKPLDLDKDGDVDQDDFGLWQRSADPAPVVTSRPWIYPAGCACVMSGSPGGSAMTCAAPQASTSQHWIGA